MYGGIIGTINNAALVSQDSLPRHLFHTQTYAPQASF